MKKNLYLAIFLIPFLTFSQSVFINEVHYDNDGTDADEGIEIAGPAGTDLSTYSLVLYNGNGGAVYSTVALSGNLPDQQNGFGTAFFSIAGLQNGSPDGMALVEGSTVIQFLSYEGTITAVDGPAIGLLSTDLGVAESSSTPLGLSLQLVGEGTTYSDFSWAAESASSYDMINAGQVFGTVVPTVFINEIHYDNDGTDVNEAIELAGNSGTDLAGWNLYLYNGSNGEVYNTVSLSGTFTDQDNGFGTLFFSIEGIQNGSPDGIALADPSDNIIQFLSYEGTLTAADGPAIGLLSEDIGIAETSSTPVDFSLQLTGVGQSADAFSWVADVSTFGSVNTGQSFGGGSDPDPDPDPVVGTLFINEIHYDNDGTDADEGIEVAGTAGLDLTGFSLVLYNGSGGTVYNTVNLTGVVPDLEAGFGTVFFAISGVQNGSPDGIALVAPDNSLMQFLSYEGSFIGVGGVADGISSEDIGVEEGSSTSLGYSLQLEGTGSEYSDFTWAAPGISTYDQINTNQAFSAPAQQAFINEIHYDNDGTDADEGIEIAGTAGLDLTGWSLQLYNGNGGTVYNTTALSGIIPSQDNGYGTLSFSVEGLQNGSPDGVALVAPGDNLIQFLSYEGAFTAVGGVADGLLSEDIGVSESSSTPAGFSLQLEGDGQSYTDFTWGEAQASTFGLINANQSFGGPVDPPPASDTVTVAEARLLPLNTEVVVRAVLTATDQFGGPAYLQDGTAGIALFDELVHGEGIFNIGDEVWISASLGEFNDQVQLVSVESVELINSDVEVTPTIVTLDQLGDFEGQLVTVNDISFNTLGVMFPNTNYDISDPLGFTEVRIDGDTDLVGRNRPESTTSITAVVGRFQTSLQLLPRFIADLPGTTPYEPGGSDIPFSTTMDIATWNMEFFGTTISGFGPSDVTLQASNASVVLMALNADIIAVQEVSDDELLQTIVDEMTGYGLVCSDVYSRSYEEPDPNDPFPPQKLCYIYNTATVDVISDRPVFDEFYTQARLGLISDLDDYPTSSGASSFWSSGRLPYQLIADVTISGTTKRVNLINIHAKSGSDTEDLERRVYDNTVLKDSLDAQYADDAIILLGDYNDDVFTSIGGGPSTYEVILNDTENFKAATASLSSNEIPTFIGSSSTIDHLSISNELFEDFIEGSESIYFPFNDIDDYEGTTSDHLPVLVRFDIIPTLEAVITEEQTVFFGYEPESEATLEVTPTGGAAPYSFLWDTGETTASITVAPDDTTSYSVTVTDVNGEQVMISTIVNVVNVECQSNSNGKTKVQVCFKGKELCVPENAVNRLIDKGAVLGSCDADGVQLSNFKVYPNPFVDNTSLNLESTGDAEVGILVKSFRSGKVVMNEVVSVSEGTSDIPIDLAHAKRGFYILVVKNNTTDTVEKAIFLLKK